MAEPDPVVAVLAADTHLDLPGGAWLNRKIRGDSAYAFEQLVELAILHRVPLVVAGDLLEVARPHSATVEFFHRQMRLCQDAGVKFYFIQGQHELSSPPWFSSHAWPVHIDGKVVDVGGVKLYGLDCRRTEEFDEAVARIPEGVDWLVAHQVWNEVLAVGALTHKASFAQLPAHITRVFTGDYHQHYAHTDSDQVHRRPPRRRVGANGFGRGCRP